MARRKGGGHGGHGWFVTFADLMALMMSFFVVVVAGSTQEKDKMMAIAGSFREAFGNNKDSRLAGVIELDAVPTRNEIKNVGQFPDASEITSPKIKDATEEALPGASSGEAESQRMRTEMLVRQAMQSNTELAALASQVIFEETPDGLAIQIVDQDGRSMFANGAAQPNEQMVLLLETVSRQLVAFPNRISIFGHTASVEGDGGFIGDRGWSLSTLRALASREIMARNGIASDRFEIVAGRAATEPYHGDDPSLSINRRVTLLLHDASSVMPE